MPKIKELMEDETLSFCEDADDEKLSLRELKDKYYLLAKSKKNTSVKNRDTGDSIRISQKGINEWASKSKSREQILSIKCIDFLLANAKKTREAFDRKNRKHVLGFDYYSCPIKINGRDFTAIISVEKTDNIGSLYYHHYLKDKN